MLNALVKDQVSEAMVYIPKGNLDQAEANLEECGVVDAYASGLAALVKGCRLHMTNYVTKSALESAKEITCELLAWTLPHAAKVRAAALTALAEMWGLLVDSKTGEQPLTVTSYLFGNLTAEKVTC